MHPAAASGRGPSPWRRPASADPPRLLPRTRAEGVFAAAVVQLFAVLAWSLLLLWLAGWAYGDGASALACVDGDEAACTDPAPFPLARFLIQSGAWAAVMAAAALAVVVAWRHRRADGLDRTALIAFAAPAIAALAANRLAEIPLTLS